MNGIIWGWAVSLPSVFSCHTTASRLILVPGTKSLLAGGGTNWGTGLLLAGVEERLGLFVLRPLLAVSFLLPGLGRSVDIL